uniref:glycosyltransferase n=1 Tax=uncultured Erythrobacter sp. TaxID=263913 RepID=UPI00262CAC85|nr:glycosyltransferase [uncultured Erythrobacter sp.]
MTSQSTLPDVSILIVAYQSHDVIAACINAIAAACRHYRYEVLLIDNGDGSTAAFVDGAFPDVRIVPSKGNIGFAAGNNALAQLARAPYLLLANPDLEMREGAVDELMDGALRYPDAAAWGGVTLNREGTPDIGNSVHVPSLKEMVSRLVGRSSLRLAENETYCDDRRVEALSGSFVMLSREAWNAASGLDESYFLYCEEVDLFFRLSRMKFELWRIGSARAFHDAGHGDGFAPMRLVYRAAGTMQFVRLHWSYPRQFCAFALIWLGAFIRFMVGSAFGQMSPHLHMLGIGYRRMALSPTDWCFGYDPEKGLLAKLKLGRT